MRYSELREAVDVIEVRQNLLEIGTETFSYIVNHFREKFSAEPELRDDMETYLEDAMNYHEHDSAFNEFFRFITEKTEEYINRYLKEKYGDVKPVKVEISFISEDEDSTNRRKDGGSAGISDDETYYEIDVAIDLDQSYEKLLSSMEDIFINDRYYDDPDIHILLKNILKIETTIHELEHIEQYIKSGDKVFNNPDKFRIPGIKANLDKNLSKEDLINIMRQPNENNLKNLLYFTSNIELDAFTTEAANSIIESNGISELSYMVKNDTKAFLNAIKYDFVVDDIISNITSAYKDENIIKSEKLDKQIQKVINRVYLLVIRKLTRVITKRSNDKSATERFIDATSKKSIERAVRAFFAERDEHRIYEIKGYLKSSNLDDFIDMYLYVYVQSVIRELEIDEIVKELPEKIKNNPVISNRVEKFKQNIYKSIINNLSGE